MSGQKVDNKIEGRNFVMVDLNGYNEKEEKSKREFIDLIDVSRPKQEKIQNFKKRKIQKRTSIDLIDISRPKEKKESTYIEEAR